MADEKPKDSQLADTLKALAERGSSLKDPGELGKLLEMLSQRYGTSSVPKDPLAALLAMARAEIQKKAAETNEVDTGLANAWFDRHWKQPRKCPICEQINWAMAPKFSHVSLDLLGRMRVPKTFPCVIVTCRTCGNTLSFNAVAMELLPDGAE
ncbi:MAG: hypothetical protein ACYDC3_02325 [Candidatus Binataceae bacterium]